MNFSDRLHSVGDAVGGYQLIENSFFKILYVEHDENSILSDRFLD